LTCPSVDRLADYGAGRLPQSERDAVQRHAADCAACRVALSDLGRSLGQARATAGGPPIEWQTDGHPVVERYLLRKRLGAGAMGVVYLAHDAQLDRPVALKILHHLSADGGEALLEEARALARVRHPNVVTVFDAVLHGGRLCVVMEYVDGVTLRARIAAGPRRWRQTLDLFIEAGRGLAAAQAAGIAHGDFKPDNVLVSRDGRVQVSDFGLARPAHGSAGSGPALGGTPAYMAPEQLAGSGADARTDQFAFCVALYEALYDRRPFAASSVEELRQEMLRQAPSFAADRRPPRAVTRALGRGLAPDPEARYPSMAALVADLESWPRRRRLFAGSIAALALSLLVVRAIRYEKTPLNRICRVDSRHAGALLNDEQRAARRALAPSAPAEPDGIEAALDAYVRRWVTARVGACEDADATEATDPAAHARYADRLRCFDELHARVESAVSALSRPPFDLGASRALVAALPPPEACLAR
jgi:predicted Ser/Thr protein kinase